jgi:hypothetical protein
MPDYRKIIKAAINKLSHDGVYAWWVLNFSVERQKFEENCSSSLWIKSEIRSVISPAWF